MTNAEGGGKVTAQIYDGSNGVVLAEATADTTKLACEWIRNAAKDYSSHVDKYWWHTQNGNKTEIDFGSHRYFARIIV